MKMIAINKHSGKLKIWSVKMPNAPYSGRYQQNSYSRTSEFDKQGKYGNLQFNWGEDHNTIN